MEENKNIVFTHLTEKIPKVEQIEDLPSSETSLLVV